MARIEHDKEQCARMLMKGMSPTEICTRLGKPLTAVEALLSDPAVIARHQEMMREKLGADLYDDATLFTDDQLNDQVDKLTKPALRALIEVLEDPKASAASKVKAAEMALGWQKAIATRTKQADEGEKSLMQPIYMNKRAADALERIASEFEGEDWEDKLLQEISRMPESRS